MPIIKSAKKRVLQAKKAYDRNKHYGSRMRTMIKNIIKETDAEKAEKMLPEAYSSIDVALKKNLLHRNNAARKKARIAKIVSHLKTTPVEKTEVENVAPLKKVKTTAVKKTVKKTVKKPATNAVKKARTVKKVEAKK